MRDLSSKVLECNHRAIARLITLVENNSKEAINSMKKLHKHSGKAHVIGITGVMGSGKSSLIFELAKIYRKQNKKIGIIAIDPTSPFSGGALLGDRIRMMDLSCDDGIFIRSMGTRGMLGGLTGAVYDVVEILDAAGMDIIIIETVGVGQSEVDIIKIADTTCVVLVPGLGDSIQTIKAGIMEIADIFVVNKSDKPGTEQTVAEIESMLDIILKDRKIPIVQTSTKKNKGLDELAKQISIHLKYIKKCKIFEKNRRERYEVELVEIIKKQIMNLIFDESKIQDKIDNLIEEIEKKNLDPHTAAEKIIKFVIK